MPENTLYYGDNLEVMRKYLPDASVDLVYLDPPFNSNRDYNLLFREQSGEPAQGQIKAFTDTWQWSERAYDEFCHTCPVPALVALVQGFVRTLGRNDITAYLVMMAPRLVELHRVLKPTGSLYLHCDYLASSYLRVMLDVVFGAKNFRNEIVWKRTSAHANVGKRYGVITDTILFYTKTQNYKWNMLYTPYSEEHIQNTYRYIEEGTGRRYALRDLTASMQRASSGQLYEWKGIRPPASRCWAYTRDQMERFESERRIVYSSKGYPRLKVYLDEMPGVPLQNLWTDLPPISSHSAERLGYPTQKPLALLERILQASSNEGDTVLDPFCGCGTAIVAAQKLNRRWIGIDITHLAIALIKYRLSDMFDLKEGEDYRVVGEPTTVAEARALALQDRDEFQKWAIGLIPRARPYQDKKGKDTGHRRRALFQGRPERPQARADTGQERQGEREGHPRLSVGTESRGGDFGVVRDAGAADAEYGARGGAGGVLHDAVGQPAHSAPADSHRRRVAGGHGFCDTERGVVDGRGAGGAGVAVGRAGVVGDVGCCSYPQPLSLRGRRGILLEC
jgi:site-specific DNA-methyltransferase (adenine-specific)